MPLPFPNIKDDASPWHHKSSMTKHIIHSSYTGFDPFIMDVEYSQSQDMDQNCQATIQRNNL
jgi:hypothetical protein